jgi:hypothetical protein
VVLDTDTAAFCRYAVLILPEAQAMSDAMAAALRAFPGRLIAIGDTGWYDEWLNERDENALTGVPRQHFAAVDSALVTAADTGLLSTDASPNVQIGLHRTRSGYALVLVNLATAPAPAFNLDLRLADGEAVIAAHLSTPDGTEVEVPFSFSSGNHAVHLDVSAGIDTLALLTLTSRLERRYVPSVGKSY